MLTPQELFPEYYTKLAGFVEEREQQRRKYKPEAVRVLLIGESMPHRGGFFYYANSGLYKSTQEAFEMVFGPSCGTGERFLEFFKESGCYLNDLCPFPVDNLNKPERKRIRRQSIPLLAYRLRQYDPQPEQVVIVLKSIVMEVREALSQANADGIDCIALPFPSDQLIQHQEQYKDGMVATIKTTSLQAVLDPRTSLESM